MLCPGELKILQYTFKLSSSSDQDHARCFSLQDLSFVNKSCHLQTDVKVVEY